MSCLIVYFKIQISASKVFFKMFLHYLCSHTFYILFLSFQLPFSKFFLASQGRLLDKQGPVLMDRINWIGITLGDKVDGPFSLEIDSIKAEYDPNHFEEFAYEQYGGFKV